MASRRNARALCLAQPSPGSDSTNITGIYYESLIATQEGTVSGAVSS